MNREAYYERMKALARGVRAKYNLTTPQVRRSDMRRIYKDCGIRIDLRPFRSRNLRGAYFDDANGTSVMIAKNLPDDPFIFTLGHELKHHLEDRKLGLSFCRDSNQSEPIEIGAEVFAAELLFPDSDFGDHLGQMGISSGQCTAETLVRLKRATQTTLSYQGLSKKAVRLGFASSGTFNRVAWRRLEESLYGEPVYKRIQRFRRLRDNLN